MPGIPSSEQAPNIMSKVLIMLCACLVLGVGVMDLLIFINFNRDAAVVLHSPVAGSANPLSFRAMGYAWDKQSIIRKQDIEVTVRLKRTADGKLLSFPAVRSAVKSSSQHTTRDGGFFGSQILFHLAAFSAQVTLPESADSGSWLISACMTTGSGHTLETAAREIIIDARAPSRDFHFFST